MLDSTPPIMDRLQALITDHLRKMFAKTSSTTEVELRLGRLLWIERGGSASSPDTVRVADKYLDTGGEQWRLPYALDTNDQIVFVPSIGVPTFAAINETLNREVEAGRATMLSMDDVLGYFANPLAPDRNARMEWREDWRMFKVDTVEDKMRWPQGRKNLAFPGAPWDVRISVSEETRSNRLLAETDALVKRKRIDCKFLRQRKRNSYVLTAAPQIRIDITCVMNFDRPADVGNMAKLKSAEHVVELELMRLPGRRFDPDLAAFYARQIATCIDMLRVVDDIDVEVRPLLNTGNRVVGIAHVVRA